MKENIEIIEEPKSEKLEIKLSNKNLMALSKIIGKMDIKKELIGIDGATKEEAGTQLIVVIATNLYKAEKEYYEFVANVKKISIEEAEEIDAFEFFKELFKIEGLKSFLS